MYYLSFLSSRFQYFFPPLYIGGQLLQHICKMYFLMAKFILPNCKIYMSKFKNIFIWIARCICFNCKMYFLSWGLWYFFALLHMGTKMAVSTTFSTYLPNVFFKIAKFICPNCQIYLSKLPNLFVNSWNVFI